MNWPRALTYVGIWVLLSVYYFAFERDRREAHDGVEPPPVGLVTAPEAITEIEIETAERLLRCRRTADEWEVVEPPNSRVPSDLIGALIGALAELQSVPVVRSGTTTSEEEEPFGLHRPRTRITLGGSGSRLTIRLGERNPAQTAVYARREGQPEILLLGLNVEYYVDLLLEALRRQNA